MCSRLVWVRKCILTDRVQCQNEHTLNKCAAYTCRRRRSLKINVCDSKWRFPRVVMDFSFHHFHSSRFAYHFASKTHPQHTHTHSYIIFGYVDLRSNRLTESGPKTSNEHHNSTNETVCLNQIVLRSLEYGSEIHHFVKKGEAYSFAEELIRNDESCLRFTRISSSIHLLQHRRCKYEKPS